MLVPIRVSPLRFKFPSNRVSSCMGKLREGSVKIKFGNNLNRVSDEKMVASVLAFRFWASAPLSQFAFILKPCPVEDLVKISSGKIVLIFSRFGLMVSIFNDL